MLPSSKIAIALLVLWVLLMQTVTMLSPQSSQAVFVTTSTGLGVLMIVLKTLANFSLGAAGLCYLYSLHTIMTERMLVRVPAKHQKARGDSGSFYA